MNNKNARQRFSCVCVCVCRVLRVSALSFPFFAFYYILFSNFITRIFYETSDSFNLPPGYAVLPPRGELIWWASDVPPPKGELIISHP